MALEALIFDVDGTLAETEEVHRQAFNTAFREFGLPWDWSPADYEKLLRTTGGRQRMLRYMEEVGFAHPDREALAKDLHRRKTEVYNERLAGGGVVFRPGVRRLLEEAQAAGLKLAIATTTSPENVETLLAASLGPEGKSWFDVIGNGPCVPNLKPAPDIYLWVLERLGLGAKECVAFEDSQNGLKAARAAGLACIVTPARYTGHDDFTGALAILDCLGEPDAPFKVLKGEAFGGGWADVGLIRRWHALSIVA